MVMTVERVSYLSVDEIQWLQELGAWGLEKTNTTWLYDLGPELMKRFKAFFDVQAKDAEIERLCAALETIVFLTPSAVGADGAYRLGRVAQRIAREALADQNGESDA